MQCCSNRCRLRILRGLWRVGDNEQCCLNGGLPDYQDPVYDWSLFSYRQYEQFRDHTPGFASLAAFESSDHEMAVRRTGSDHPPQPWYGEFVSGNSFDTLGLRRMPDACCAPLTTIRAQRRLLFSAFRPGSRNSGAIPRSSAPALLSTVSR